MQGSIVTLICSRWCHDHGVHKQSAAHHAQHIIYSTKHLHLTSSFHLFPCGCIFIRSCLISTFTKMTLTIHYSHTCHDLSQARLLCCVLSVKLVVLQRCLTIDIYVTLNAFCCTFCLAIINLFAHLCSFLCYIFTVFDIETSNGSHTCMY